jgi:hypothetical protein
VALSRLQRQIGRQLNRPEKPAARHPNGIRKRIPVLRFRRHTDPNMTAAAALAAVNLVQRE